MKFLGFLLLHILGINLLFWGTTAFDFASIDSLLPGSLSDHLSFYKKVSFCVGISLLYITIVRLFLILKASKKE